MRCRERVEGERRREREKINKCYRTKKTNEIQPKMAKKNRAKKDK
jgi:hypothetical protein